MIQIELYVDGVEAPARLLTEVFGFEEIENRPGWRNVEYKGLYQIMLYDPRRNEEHKAEDFMPAHDGKAGQGMQMVISVADAKAIRPAVLQQGYNCGDLHDTAWNTLEFIFSLAEGYVIRVKQWKNRIAKE